MSHKLRCLNGRPRGLNCSRKASTVQTRFIWVYCVRSTVTVGHPELPVSRTSTSYPRSLCRQRLCRICGGCFVTPHPTPFRPGPRRVRIGSRSRTSPGPSPSRSAGRASRRPGIRTRACCPTSGRTSTPARRTTHSVFAGSSQLTETANQTRRSGAPALPARAVRLSRARLSPVTLLCPHGSNPQTAAIVLQHDGEFMVAGSHLPSRLCERWAKCPAQNEPARP